MRYDPELRIGCREGGVLEIKQHPFFASIDWKLLERKGIDAPFKPNITNGATDVSNFEEAFTNMQLALSPTNQRFKDLYADQMQMESFTYVKSNNLAET